MKTSFLEQVSKALKDRGKRSRWISVVLCLALLVSFGTFHAFMRQGQAKVRTEKVLACQFAAHRHTSSCYNDDGELSCGQADYVVHTHNDDCYDAEGRLVCQLPELAYHVHSEDCYVTEELLICDHVPVDEGHKHTDACYEEREPEDAEAGQACALEEHVHTAECYTRTDSGSQPELICGESEHTHDDSCYEVSVTEELTCGEPEHTHSDSCYTESVTEELTCGEVEEGEHTHDSGCYTEIRTTELTCSESEHTHDSGCYTRQETRTLVCGQPEHTHSGSCCASPEAEAEEVLTCEKPEHTHDDSCGGTVQTERVLICGEEERDPVFNHTSDCYQVETRMICGEMEIIPHTHSDACYDGEGNVVCGKLEVRQHVHGPECFITITVSEDEAEYVCGKLAHAHEESCYDENGELICPLEEHEHTSECLPEPEWQCGRTAHTHGGDCYENGELVCPLEEHEHTDQCLAPQPVPEPEPEWQCGKTAHTHGESCYENGELVCPLEEHEHTSLCLEALPEPEWLCGRMTHTHDSSCYGEDGELVCPLEEHIHSAECLIELQWQCGKTAHTHDEGCYDANGELICPLEEHEHTTACLAGQEENWPCGKAAHAHGPECYDANGVLICTLEEHEHTQACLALPELIQVSEEYPYATESGLFDILFRVEGSILVPREADSDDTGSPEDTGVSGEETAPPEEAAAPEEEGYALHFAVDPLYEGTEYDIFAQESERLEEMLLDVLAVHLSCDSQDLDLSMCRITAEITPTQLLREVTAESASVMFADENGDGGQSEDTVLRLTVREADAGQGVNDLDSVYLSEPENGGPVAGDPVDGDAIPAVGLDEDAAADSAVSEGLSSEESAGGENASEPAQSDPVQNEPAGEVWEPETMYASLRGNTLALFAARDVNPEFTVQYYAYIDRLATSKDTAKPDGYNAVPMYDTETGGLPQNGNGNTTHRRDLYSNKSGDVLYRENVLTKLFNARTFRYFEAPSFAYYDILPPTENTNVNHYNLQALWILKDGRSPESENPEDWDVRTNFDALRFTNSPQTVEQDPSYILVSSNTVIRLVYDANGDRDYRNPAAFYDFDISNGVIYTQQYNRDGALNTANQHKISEQKELEKQGETLYMYTDHQGINSNGNTLGFGNSEGNTTKGGLGNNKVSIDGREVFINQANVDNYGKAAYGLVTGMSGGKVQYRSGVTAPNIFNEGTANGKAGFGGALHFIRNGDTYTLSAVSGSNTRASNLEQLPYQGPNWNNTWELFSNNFWPMDAASTWGADGHDMVFGLTAMESRRYSFDGPNNTNDDCLKLPKGDDGKDHNAYFGMNFSVDFQLTADYCGPLEYVFFGDDDMWVFLSSDGGYSGQLICDIGGVHSSVGQYVNLRKYIPEGTAGNYSLHFFYTERGASGSTCWMQFTLPQASARPAEVVSGDLTNTLQVSKEVSGEVDPNQDFQFRINLTDKDGNPATDAYQYTRFTSDGHPYSGETKKEIRDGDTFYLKHKEYIAIDYLPVGGHYTITELGAASTYALETRSLGVSVDGTAASGTIGAGSNTSVTDVVLVNRELVKLPETGGEGPWAYTVFGMGLLAAGALLALGRKKRA